MNSCLPLTVILPAHNAEATIGPAIASTLNQTYSDFEIWVLENGSNDRTAEIARSFPDSRVKVFELGAVGVGGAMQYAIENAPSEWLARMDADDLMFPERLKIQMSLIKERPDVVFVGTTFALLTPSGHIFQKVLSTPSREVNTLLVGKGKFFANPSTLFRRRVALEVSSLDPEFPMDDVPMWFRMLKRGRGWEIAEPLHLYRLRPNSLSQDMKFYHQHRRARAKYAPESLKHYPARDSRMNRWYHIAGLELITGDQIAIRRAADHLEKDGFATAAKLIRWRSSLGPVSYLYHNWRNRNYYRHRPDWEQLFAPFLSSQTNASRSQDI
jgi:glycosyltransferase involved in cell wall biosynthesis